jgi:hypothetical protein
METIYIYSYFDTSISRAAGAPGGAQLRYKPESRGSDSRWRHWNFYFRPAYDPGVDSASNRNKYQGYFLGGISGRCLGLTTLPPTFADCLEIWKPQPAGALTACPGL